MISKNSKAPIILDLCGGTGSWSKIFIDETGKLQDPADDISLSEMIELIQEAWEPEKFGEDAGIVENLRSDSSGNETSTSFSSAFKVYRMHKDLAKFVNPSPEIVAEQLKKNLE